MKKNIKELLKYLEKETTITFDLSIASPTLKLFNSANQPIRVNVLGINEGTLGLTVISCGCKKCKKIIGIEILYGANGSDNSQAQLIQKEIISAVPSIGVVIRDVIEDD